MSKFHTLIVKEVVQETADSVSIAFQIPDHLKNDFTYIQGQHLTFKLKINGEEIRRSYSICSSPYTDTELRVAVKRVNSGKGSNYLNSEIKAGTLLEIMTPMGNFNTPLNESNSKQYILFAGGSGITPMMSIIKSVLKVEPKSKIQLFYGNEKEDAIIFKNQLKDIENNADERLVVHHVLNQAPSGYPENLIGIMTLDKVKQLLDTYVKIDKQTEIFICGPTPMMQNVEQTLQSMNVPKNQVHIEYFIAPIEQSNASVTPDNQSAATVTIILDGEESQIKMLPGETVLEAALRNNLDAPYACQGGSCCTCRALLVEGKVEMKVNYALLDDEVKQGYILTCQSRAVTDNIIVDYDRGL